MDITIDSVPDILEAISKGVESPPISFFSLNSLDLQNSDVLQRLCKTLEFFKLIQVHGFSVTESLSRLCITRNFINLYPEGVRCCLLEVLNHNKVGAKTSLDLESLTLLGRDDLIQMVTPPVMKAMHFTASSRESARDVKAIIAGLSDIDQLIAWDGQTEADRIQISKLIFSKDRRFYEASKLLQSSKPQVLTLIQSPDWSETELLKKQDEFYLQGLTRICAISLGRSAFHFSARRPLITEKYPIPKLNFTVQMKPSNITLTLQKQLSDESLSWGYFHNGVSSGLSVSKEATYLNGSWITFNKPNTLTSQHAGFLLGLGLNGHLKNLEEWHIYNYLGPKHTHTSIALLIGMAASKLGSMDTKLTRVLSVHIVALLPLGSSDLNISTLVQTAGIIAMGLLYAGSQHRRMTETFLGEIEGRPNHFGDTVKNEGYKMAAGVSLGLINLGKGNDLHGLIDIMVVEKLLSLATKLKDVQTSMILDVSVPGAVMALLLMFLKTSNLEIAKKLAPPNTLQFYDYIRPDFLLLRTLAYCLIMWDNIGEDQIWITENIPEVLATDIFEKSQKVTSDMLPFLYVVTGLCMALGLRHASTGNETARDTLLYYLDKITHFADIPATTHDQKITKTALIQIQSSITLSAAIVMAGTGDLDTLRRVRLMCLQKKKDTSFGSFLSAQMSLGILFLGGGQFGFDRELIDIAVLAISLYPIFPSEISDNFAHLQPLRYFWALAAKPRCLVVKESDDGNACTLDVELVFKSGTVITRKAPFLLPELNELRQISINSPSYFPLTLNLEEHSPATALFFKTRMLLVTPRPVDSLLELPASNDTLHGSSASNYYSSLQMLQNIDPGEIEKITFTGKSHQASLWMVKFINNTLGARRRSLEATEVETILTTQKLATNPRYVEDLWNLKILFTFNNRYQQLQFPSTLSTLQIEELKSLLWKWKFR